MKPAFSSANILLPKNVDMNTWSVVACDQYTSEPEYWDEVYKKVGDKPSTLNLILPELYLEEPDVAERIENKGIIIGKAEGESVSCLRFCRVREVE